jgi:hypothetical protein
MLGLAGFRLLGGIGVRWRVGAGGGVYGRGDRLSGLRGVVARLHWRRSTWVRRPHHRRLAGAAARYFDTNGVSNGGTQAVCECVSRLVRDWLVRMVLVVPPRA